MNVAVGRLQLSITLAARDDRQIREPARPHSSDAVEKAYRRNQMRHDLEAERLRWTIRYHPPR